MARLPRSLALALVISFPFITTAAEPHSDLYGDPLPPGALLRLGTVRLRHDSEVTAALFLPDGKALVTASRGDQTVRIWDVETGKEIRRFRGIKQPNVLAVSPDGRTLAVGETGSLLHDNTFAVILFDLATGKTLTRRLMHPVSVTALAFGPDSTHLFSGCDDALVRVWNLTTLREERRYRGFGDTVSCLAVSADGKCLAIGGDKFQSDDYCTIALWNLENGTRIHRLDGHKNTVTDIQFTPDGRFLISTDHAVPQQKLWVWDLQTGTLQNRWTTLVKAFALRAQGKQLLMVDTERILEVRDLATGKSVVQIPDFPKYATTMALDPVGNTLACLDGTKAIRLWDLKTKKELMPARGHRDRVHSLETTPDGLYWISIGADAALRFWESTTGRQQTHCTLSSGQLNMTLSPDGSELLTSEWRGQVSRWQVPDGKKLGEFTVHGGCGSVAYFPSSGELLIGTYDDLQIVKSKSGIKINDQDQRYGHPKEVRSALVTADEKWFISTSGDERLFFWNAEKGTRFQVIYLQGSYARNKGLTAPPIVSIRLSPNGRFVAVRLAKEVRLYDIATRTEVDCFKAPSEVRQVSFSRDSRNVATVCGDGRVRIWELASGKERADFPTASHGPTCGAFSRDGRCFATGGTDTTVLVWDLSGGRLERRQRATAEQRLAAWEALVGDDAVAAYQAVWLLAADPGAPAFLQARLRPATELTEPRLAKLLTALDAAEFVERERASAELEILADGARKTMRQSAQATNSAEVRRRLREVLDHLDDLRPPRELLRHLRALEALELAGSPEALAVMKRLTKGTADARLTLESTASARRLQVR